MVKEASDEKLIKSYLSGNASGFNMLYERYKKQLYAYLNRLLAGEQAQADDIFQQTWIKIIHRLPKYRCEGKFLGWAMRIAHNQAMDHFRKQKVRGGVHEADDERIESPDNNAEPWKDMHHTELKEALESAIKQLSPELREVFLLRQDGISFKEIAAIQDCSINTALGRMQYALKNLQVLLEDWKEQIR